MNHTTSKLKLVNWSISPYVGNLSFLKELILSNNSFIDEIPQQIGHLRRLQSLILVNNSLSGEIPANISSCFNLIEIHLGGNKLVGKIPNTLGSLSKLKKLGLYKSFLTGTMPPSFGTLSFLVSFVALENFLNGSIPESLGQSTSLNLFLVGENMLSGAVPASIFNISTLTALELMGNQIQGSLPSDMFKTLPNLQIINLGLNRFITGSILVSVSNASNLEQFIVKLYSLQEFSIDINYLGSGQAGNLSTTLVGFDVSFNRIHGGIPNGIGNLVNLNILFMNYNQFTGNIPADIGRLQKIGRLGLDNNKLSGHIPSSVGNLTELTTLELQGSDLEGSIPPSLGQCRKLLLLKLSQNKLSGSITQQVWGLSSLSVVLNLSRNHLTGSLPMEVGNVKGLSSLDLYDNMSSGELPEILASDSFQGTILLPFETLRGIQVLDLSRNNLSGKIPQYLEGLHLLNLNIFFNDFEGMLPVGRAFKNTSATSVVGNSKLCSSVVEFHLPKCNFPSKESKKRRMTLALKLVICVVPAFELIILVVFPISTSIKEEAKKRAPEAILRKFSTDWFTLTNLISVGSFGSVYKGVLDDGGAQLVAIKVFNLLRQGALKSVITESEALRNIRHRNLVKIITACSMLIFKALVYEFMENGNLDEWLHLPTRTKEPNNVLLDNELTGHVADFGLARFLSKLSSNISANQISSIGIRGSVGYAAPVTISDFGIVEYGMRSEVSTYGDVSSFGILLLEMFTGKKPTGYMFSDGLNLHNFVKTEIADAVLFLQGGIKDTPKQRSATAQKLEECLSLIFRTGIECSAESSRDRKGIRDAASALRSIRDVLL
ncbi:LOW QUALITY PROTEIN: hypothetical protein PRUPE_4G283000 [Prunus persica]|uniref:Protein kinase domain-containing protein n=1 Tax=Prunus persica TaxID=3760 RepID=A0A251PSM2_PRUPE|nr:LOW QUALITY PROTEIN: hypothetical protein PRUPE_4G283000 [Prunus persica]